MFLNQKGNEIREGFHDGKNNRNHRHHRHQHKLQIIKKQPAHNNVYHNHPNYYHYPHHTRPSRRRQHNYSLDDQIFKNNDDDCGVGGGALNMTENDVIELVMRSRDHENNNDITTTTTTTTDDSSTRIHPKENVDDPKFVQRPCDRIARLGETAKFKCKVSGTRPMEVFWFKMNGDELVNDEKYEIYHDDEFHYLKVYNTVQRDSGMYLCVISNEREQNVDSFFLRLRGNFFRIIMNRLIIKVKNK